MLRLDEKWGLVYTLGSPRRVYIGLNIGGPASAGAAGLTAARKERDFLKALREAERVFFLSHVFAQRWADDFLIIYRQSTRRRLLEILLILEDESFYGGRLRLLLSRKAIAFGFRVELDGECMAMRNALGFIPDRRGPMFGPWRGRPTTFHGGDQWQSPRVVAGIVKGHLTRVLVGAGLSRDRKMGILLRTAFELVEVGTNPASVARITNKVSRSQCFDTQFIKSALHWDQTKRRQWIGVFDEYEDYMRVREGLLARTHSL